MGEVVFMRLNTRSFGELDVEVKHQIHFEQGLLGFSNEKDFVLLRNYDTEDPVPFMWLQSINDPEIAFVLTIPSLVDGEYDFDLNDDLVKMLHVNNPEDVAVFNVVKIPDTVDNMTVNLKSPIIINV